MTRKLLLLAGLLWSTLASAQFAPFIPGQILTAAELNSAFGLYAPLTGATFTGPISATSLMGTPISGSTGAFTQLAATSSVIFPAGSLSLSDLATESPNTIVANATGSSATPTAISAPSCGTASSALQWLSGTGLACNTAINASTLGGITAASYLTSATAASTYSPISSPTFTGTTTAANLAVTGSISGAGAATLLAPYALLASPTFTGTPAAPTAATGTNTTQLATTAFVSASPKITTPTVVGEATGVASPAGSWGETVTASGTSISLTSGSIANCATMPLTAGKWMLYGSISFNPAGSTVMSGASAGISTTTGAVPAVPLYSSWSGTAAAGSTEIFTVPTQIVNPSSSTSYFLVGAANFTVSTAAMTCQVSALRIP